MVIYNNGWSVTNAQQKFLFATCNITGLTSYYVYKSNSPKYLQYPIYAVWIASNLYWIHPIDNWRKKVDMLLAHTCIPFLSVCGVIYKPPYWYLTSFAISGSALLFRKISMYYYNLLEKLHDETNKHDKEGNYVCPIKYGYSWKSVLAHGGIHLCTNVFVGLTAWTWTWAQQNNIIPEITSF